MASGYELEPTTQKLLAANHTEIPVMGTVVIRASIGKTMVTIQALVSQHVHDPMLGIDWLERNQVLWDFSAGRISIGGHYHVLKSRSSSVLWSRRILLSADVSIPPVSEMQVNTYVQCRHVERDTDLQRSTWIADNCRLRPGVMSARTLIPDQMTNVPVRVLNLNDQTVTMKKGSTVAQVQPVQVLEPHSTCLNGATDPLPSELEVMLSKVDEAIPTPIVSQLRSIVTKYSSAFSEGPTDLGWTDMVVHSIDTADAPPFRQPLRRHPIAYQSAIDEQLMELSSQGVIEPCRSPWASNLVLAKKKDGSIRCCVDFRQLNNLTKRDAYPLPRTDACLEAMAGACWFSTFDLRSGYHQVALNTDDRDKTAFICHRGQYRFRTMPFGLNGAGATFQRLMDLVLTGLNLETCLVYLDDIIVFSSTPEEHLQRLRQVLERIQSCGLKLKPSKCALLQRSVNFLGHVVSADGVATDPEKVRLVTQWPTPTNLGELRSFLGLSGYYRRYVRDYSKVASPLTDLMKKNQRFVWSDSCQTAFDTLKEQLASPPILSMPNDRDTFVLDTDASDRAIGAVLSQVQGGQERVIAYAGRCLSRAEANYCITRKELLSIVHFTRYFRHYLLGKRFLLRTDHSALTWLHRTRDPIGQNARWLEQLGEFDLDVQHRPGQRHGNADALSRRPCPIRSPCTACRPKGQHFTCARVGRATGTKGFFDEPAGHPPDWSVETLKEAQSHDPDLAPLLSIGFPSGDRPPYADVSHLSSASKSLWYQWNRMFLLDGLVYREFETADGLATHSQLYIPEGMRDAFMTLVHTGMTGGHLGRRKTEGQLSRRAYWPSWTSDVRLFLKRCETCAKYHRGKPPRQTRLKPFTAGEPFELISIDITGPHPTSRKGNQFLLTMVDSFSKWAEAFPIRDHHADTVARQLTTHVFPRFGVPKQLLSDRGPEFESTLFTELCRSMGVEKLRTTSFKASTNGAVERFHATINSMLAKVVQEDQRNWDECVPMVLAAYRASRHESTGMSPNFIVFGRENRAPIDLILPDPNGPTSSTVSVDSYVERLTERNKQAYRLVRDHLAKAAEYRKNLYDTRVKDTKFTVGDPVWYFYPRRRKGKSPKWSNYYVGPYEVVRVIPPCNYVIRKSDKSKPLVTHGDKLKRCYRNDPPVEPNEGVQKCLSPTRAASPPPSSPAPAPTNERYDDYNRAIESPSVTPPRRTTRARKPKVIYTPS